MKKLIVVLALALGTIHGAFAQATTPTDHSAHHPAAVASAADAPEADLTDAEVRRIDKAAGKITLRHGEIKNLDMPPMTMVFQVKEAALLDGLNTGDKVKFRVVKEGGQYRVTQIKLAP
ncbi:MAG: copper-binding protein [Pseudomonadota bacterium]